MVFRIWKLILQNLMFFSQSKVVNWRRRERSNPRAHAQYEHMHSGSKIKMADGTYYRGEPAADYSQATNNLGNETHKRALENDKEDYVSAKRANFNAKSPMLKTMVPNHIAGSIIGKKGQTIQILQEQTGAKLKLSSANEFYPGTSERVVVILGELHQILAMLDLITEKIRSELPGRGGGPSNPERCNMIKLIIPNSTAGMVIGKGGCFIRGITEETGAKLQISHKDLEIPAERVITITGEPDQVKAAATAVVTKCQDDPEHGVNTNLNYSGYARNAPGSSSGPSTSMAGALGNLSTLLGLGTANQESSNANLLAQASMLASNSLGSNPLSSNPLATANPLSAMLGMQHLGGTSPGNAITTTATYEMSVPDHLVGIILGKGGKTLNEFMQFSNAVITISHKGEFITGTTNRKVVITGDPTSVQTAYFLISQKIMQEAPKLGSTFT